MRDPEPGEAGFGDMGSTDQDDRRALEQALAAIAADHSEVPVEELRALLLARYGRTADASVQRYRVVLAERDVRLELRRRR